MDPDLFPSKPKPKPPADTDTLDLFATAPPNTRTPDHETSEEAAARINASTPGLRKAIYELIALKGPMTAIEAEEMPCWAHLAPSTIRKRCSELYALGWLDSLGRIDVTTKDGRTTSSNLLKAVSERERPTVLAKLDARRERGREAASRRRDARGEVTP